MWRRWLCSTGDSQDQHAHDEDGDGSILAGREAKVADVCNAQKVEQKSHRRIEHRQPTHEESWRAWTAPAQPEKQQCDRQSVERLVQPQIVADNAVAVRTISYLHLQSL